MSKFKIKLPFLVILFLSVPLCVLVGEVGYGCMLLRSTYLHHDW